MSHLKILKHIQTGEYSTMESQKFYDRFGCDHPNGWIVINSISNRESNKVGEYIADYENKQKEQKRRIKEACSKADKINIENAKQVTENQEIINYYEAVVNVVRLMQFYCIQHSAISAEMMQLELYYFMDDAWSKIEKKIGKKILQSTIDIDRETIAINPQYTLGADYTSEEMIIFLEKNSLKDCIMLEKHDSDIKDRSISSSWCILTIKDYEDYVMYH
jgi:hypothetical protein